MNKEPAFYMGVVEDRNDPLMLGRVRVRVLGLHTHDKAELPTADLPWAYKIQPTTSGAISGIGHAPVGVMEGTWVVVQYIDPDKQMPFVIGALGGIPGEQVGQTDIPTTTAPVTTTDGTVVTDGSGNPIQTTPTGIVDANWKAKVKARLGELESSNNYSAINQLYYVGKYQFGAPALIDLGYVKTGTTSNKALKNTDPSVWTGKDDIKVLDDYFKATMVQEKIMDTYMDRNYKTLKRIGVDMDSLNDAEKAGLIAAAHLMGAGGAKKYFKGEVTSDANGTSTEKYYREGYKSVAGSYPTGRPGTTLPYDKQPDQVDAPLNPVLTTEPVKTSPGFGFADPAGVYPLQAMIGEADTNRLARHKKIRKTIVAKKEAAEHVKVPIANGQGTWDQSPTPYNAKYPYNNVWQTESGHVQEFDDTPGRERIHVYHRTGTFTEIDHNGTQVNRIVGDGYQIFERNGYVHVLGAMNVTVDGAYNLRVDNSLNIEVHGNSTFNLHGDTQFRVGGDLELSSSGNTRIKADGEFSIDAKRIDLNSGKAGKISTIEKIKASGATKSALTVNVRKDDAEDSLETPEESTPAKLDEKRKEQVDNGVVTEKELAKPVEIEEQKKPENNNVAPKSLVCKVQPGTTEFNYTEKISTNFTLADLTQGGRRRLVAQGGMTAAEIYCNLQALAENVLEPLREAFGPFTITSCFRYGGGTSQHERGQAVDIAFPGCTPETHYDKLLEVQKKIPYDQIILEAKTNSSTGWIHISYSTSSLRKQSFTMFNDKRTSPDLFTVVKIKR